MKKEFEINEILDAVDNIFKTEEKKNKQKEIEKKSININKDDVLGLNKQAKSNKSKILVLDHMIE